MHLVDVPLLLILAGLSAYAVLGGADFGAGMWQLVGGPRLREHAHHSMGPVWEANHVWLIFVLVVCWTAYPRAFGSIMSTLAVPFFIAGIGIVLRGTAYALRSGTVSLREQRIVEIVLACSSILTPFALGAAIGGIASGRVPVGNAGGDLVSSWLNPTSALTGGLAVVTAAYLAAVYLAADGVRLGDAELVRAYRVRALVTGLVAGAVALGGPLVVRSDARPIWDGLTSGSGVVAVIVSAAAGTATLLAILQGRFQLARGTAAVAVAAIAVGWVLAQRPVFLPGLTIEEAAAGRSTLWAIIITVAIGAVVLAPSLFFLFRLVLGGRFDEHEPEPEPEPPAVATRARSRANLLLVAGACLVIGAGLMLVVDTRWALIVGVVGLFGFLVAGFVEVATAAVESEPEE
jgi:cytochrome bd ubiquinol oxidase subunit II